LINRLLWMGCLSYVLTGVALVVVGAVMPEMLAHYELSYGEGGVLVFVQFIGLLAGVLSMPAISRAFSRKKGVILGLLLISLELLIALLPPWPLVVAIAGMAGFGAGLVEASIGTIILLAIKHKQAIAMSKLEVTFGIGALAMPFIASFLIAEGLWRYSFVILGAGALLTAATWMKLTFGELETLLTVKSSGDRDRGGPRPSYGKRGLPFLVACAAFFFLYGGSEVSVVNFFPSLFMEQWSIDSALAASTVTTFWLAMVIGRVFCGVLAEKLGYFRFLGISTALSVLVLLAFPFSSQAWGGFTLSFLLGLFMAGMFAIALIFANQALPGMTEQTTSILMALNGLGGSLLPLAVGWTMDAFPVKAAFWLLFGLMAAMLLLLLFSKKRRDSLVYMRDL